MKTVIKYNGKEALRTNCRYIKGAYYEKNIDCFFINDKWYRIDSGYIEKDYETGEYVVKNENLTHGIVGFDKELNQPIKGYFTQNLYKNVTSIDPAKINNILNQSLGRLPSGLDSTSNSNKYFFGTFLRAAYTRFYAEIEEDYIISLVVNNGLFSSPEQIPYEALHVNFNIQRNDVYARIFDSISAAMFALSSLGYSNLFYTECLSLLKKMSLSNDLFDEDRFNNMISSLEENFDMNVGVGNNSNKLSYKQLYILSRLCFIISEEEYERFCDTSEEDDEFFSQIQEDLNSKIVPFKFKFKNKFSFINAGILFPILREIGVSITENRIEESLGSTVSAYLYDNHVVRTSIFNEYTRAILSKTALLSGYRQMFSTLTTTEETLTENTYEEAKFIDLKTALDCGYIEVYNTDNVVLASNLSEKQIKECYRIKKATYSNKLDYNVGSNSTLENTIKLMFENYNSNPSKEVIALEKYLGNKSFGLEFETSNGYIPNRNLYSTGLIPLRDGSLDGGIEYTTLPLSGSKGLQSLNNAVYYIDKYTNISDKCSLHVHVGNLPKTKEYGIALYMLFKQIQEELFEMIPPYKRDVKWTSDRGKDYCKPLRSLNLFKNNIVKTKDGQEYIDQSEVNKEFNKIFLFLTEGVQPNEKYNISTGIHPKQGEGKWNWNSRYYALNLLNLFFNKYGTVEFRQHTPTNNKDKIFSWLFICIAICRFAETNMVRILKADTKIDMTDVLYGYADNFGLEEESKDNLNFASYLVDYMISRKNQFDYYYIRQRQIDSSYDEISADKSYSFKTNNFEFKIPVTSE